MPVTFEEQIFVEAHLGDQSVTMGLSHKDIEMAENLPMWEAHQHEVLMRNISGFVA